MESWKGVCHMSQTEGLRFTREHEWIRRENGRFAVGISDYAQKSLGDIVFVELPEVGAELEAGDVLGTVESVKTVSDVYTPFAGRVVEVGTGLEDDPAKVNSDPYGSAIAVLEPTGEADFSALMDEAGYRKFCEEGE